MAVLCTAARPACHGHLLEVRLGVKLGSRRSPNRRPVKHLRRRVIRLEHFPGAGTLPDGGPWGRQAGRGPWAAPRRAEEGAASLVFALEVNIKRAFPL